MVFAKMPFIGFLPYFIRLRNPDSARIWMHGDVRFPCSSCDRNVRRRAVTRPSDLDWEGGNAY